MTTNAAAPSYKRHRYPAEIIAHTVWLYVRFSLSFRGVEELMAARSVTRSYETVRRWTLTFGQQYANEQEVRDRVCAYYGCALEPHLAVSEKAA